MVIRLGQHIPEIIPRCKPRRLEGLIFDICHRSIRTYLLRGRNRAGSGLVLRTIRYAAKFEVGGRGEGVRAAYIRGASRLCTAAVYTKIFEYARTYN